jgi:hypothetical protein
MAEEETPKTLFNTMFYRLFRLDHNRQLWMFCEWDKLLPLNMSNMFWGKPLYLNQSTPYPSFYKSRTCKREVWIDLKWRYLPGCGMDINYDKDIVKSLTEDFNVNSIHTSPLFTGLVGLSPDQLIREIGSHSSSYDNPELRNKLSSLLVFNPRSAGFIGSLAISIPSNEASDYDIAVNMPLSKMPDFAQKVWSFKKHTRYIQKDKIGMQFPYKVFFENERETQVEVDLFPKAIDIENHVLAGARKWTISGPKQQIEFLIINTDLSHEGWPVLRNYNGEMIVILCNGFRGIFHVGQKILGQAFKVCITKGNTKIEVWVIDDPFRDIIAARDYFQSPDGEFI